MCDVARYRSHRTLFPAEAGPAEDPELLVVEVDLPAGGQEGVGQLPVQTVETGVQRRAPAVSVVEDVEPYTHTHTHTRTHTHTHTRTHIWISYLPL